MLMMFGQYPVSPEGLVVPVLADDLAVALTKAEQVLNSKLTPGVADDGKEGYYDQQGRFFVYICGKNSLLRPVFPGRVVH